MNSPTFPSTRKALLAYAEGAASRNAAWDAAKYSSPQIARCAAAECQATNLVRNAFLSDMGAFNPTGPASGVTIYMEVFPGRGRPSRVCLGMPAPKSLIQIIDALDVGGDPPRTENLSRCVLTAMSVRGSDEIGTIYSGAPR